MLIIQVVIFLSIVLLALWLERRSEPKKATKQQAADKGEWISRWDRISRQAAIADAVERIHGTQLHVIRHAPAA